MPRSLYLLAWLLIARLVLAGGFLDLCGCSPLGHGMMCADAGVSTCHEGPKASQAPVSACCTQAGELPQNPPAGPSLQAAACSCPLLALGLKDLSPDTACFPPLPSALSRVCIDARSAEVQPRSLTLSWRFALPPPGPPLRLHLLQQRLLC